MLSFRLLVPITRKSFSLSDRRKILGGCTPFLSPLFVSTLLLIPTTQLYGVLIPPLLSDSRHDQSTPPTRTMIPLEVSLVNAFRRSAIVYNLPLQNSLFPLIPSSLSPSFQVACCHNLGGRVPTVREPPGTMGLNLCSIVIDRFFSFFPLW